MSSNIPVSVQVSQKSFFVKIAILIALVFVFTYYDIFDAFFYVIAGYGLSIILAKKLIAVEHSKGIKLVKEEMFQEAIKHFENSYSYFKRNKGLDNLLTILGSSQTNYKEAALNNVAFCYGQIGDGFKARAYYEQVLEEYPNNGVAKVNLRLLNSMENSLKNQLS